MKFNPAKGKPEISGTETLSLAELSATAPEGADYAIHLKPAPVLKINDNRYTDLMRRAERTAAEGAAYLVRASEKRAQLRRNRERYRAAYATYDRQVMADLSLKNQPLEKQIEELEALAKRLNFESNGYRQRAGMIADRYQNNARKPLVVFD